jgi:hypothetical protein
MNKTIYQLLKMILQHNISLLTSGFKAEWYVPPVLILKLYIYPHRLCLWFHTTLRINTNNFLNQY